MGWALGWAGLGWAGLGWAGLGWAGLGWAGLGLKGIWVVGSEMLVRFCKAISAGVVVTRQLAELCYLTSRCLTGDTGMMCVVILKVLLPLPIRLTRELPLHPAHT